jgi:hypothetical protein
VITMEAGGVDGPRRGARRGLRILLVIGVAAALAVVGAVFSYRAGLHAGRTVTVHTGVAYSSGEQATAIAAHWAYDVPLGSDSNWYGAGSEHLGSTPSCLPPGRQVHLTFGTVSFYRDGALNKTVVWVLC